MKKIILLNLLLFVFAGFASSQTNLKIVEFKILKFEQDKKTELTVPKGQNWRIESMVTRRDDKIEFYIDDVLYVLLYKRDIGLSDGFRPFTIPEETKFSIKPLDGEIAICVAVLKIE